MFLEVCRINVNKNTKKNSREISDSTKIPETDNKTLQAEEEIAKKIHLLIEHFKLDDPVGLPDGILPVPEPAVNS
jgi:hypothetical protein